MEFLKLWFPISFFCRCTHDKSGWGPRWKIFFFYPKYPLKNLFFFSFSFLKKRPYRPRFLGRCTHDKSGWGPDWRWRKLNIPIPVSQILGPSGPGGCILTNWNILMIFSSAFDICFCTCSYNLQILGPSGEGSCILTNWNISILVLLLGRPGTSQSRLCGCIFVFGHVLVFLLISIVHVQIFG